MTVPESHEPLDQDAVSRIIRRAVEIDSAAAAPVEPGLSVEALVSAATEVGVSPTSVHHAIALERLDRVTPMTSRRIDRIVGPSEVAVERHVPMGAGELLERIESRLGSNHQLRRVERSESGSTWERRRDVAASVQLAVRRMFGDGRLGSARQVDVAVEQIPPASDELQPVSSVVRISVQRSTARTGALVAGSAAGAAGLGAAAVGGVMVAPAAAALAVPGLLAGAAITWRSRSKARHLESELKVLVDRVTHDEPSVPARVIRRLNSSA